MSYVVYDNNGVYKVKSKGLARTLGIKWLIEFKSFYDAVDWIHENGSK